MGIISQLKTNIGAKILTIAGSDFSELSNTSEIEKNAFKGASKRYGILSGSSAEVPGTTCFLTVNQEFQLILTNSYYSNSKASDVDKLSKTVELQDLMRDIYKELKSTKAGSPSIVMHVLDLNVLDPEYLEDNNVLIIRANITIKYRSQL